MRRLIGPTGGALIAMVLVLLAPAAAAAPIDCGEDEEWDPDLRTCVLRISLPAPDPGPSPGEPGPAPDPGEPGVCEDDGEEVDCESELGTWYAPYSCYVSLADPQPEPGEVPWPPGETEGAIYECRTGRDGAGGAMGHLVWLPGAPDVPPPNPADLAAEAVAAMGLRAITIGVTPLGDPEGGVIGLPMYLWAEDAGLQTWGPYTRTASAGGYSVTATAQVDRIEWDMGNGDVVECTTPGTPYDVSFGVEPSPDCGYTYAVAGEYELTATSFWVVEWSGMGQSGEITFDVSDSIIVNQGEIQVVVS